MKAVQILGDPSAPEVTTTVSATQPVPQSSSEVLIRVHAAGITGPELTWPEVYNTPSRIPGHDISGFVAELGPGYAGKLSVGQEVYGMLHADRGGGQAEFVVCEDGEVVIKPEELSHADAAALPIPLLTAWEALTDRGGVKAGMRVLLTGASGAVGVMFVQLASKLTGAHVIALASSSNHTMLKNLGAQETLDYATPGWENSLEKVDVVFDTVGGDVFSKTWETVKHDGTILTIGDPAPPWAFGGGSAPEAARHPGVKYSHFIVTPNTDRLKRGAEMIAGGSLKPVPTKTFPFSESKEAWECAQGRGRGYKVVIRFSE